MIKHTFIECFSQMDWGHIPEHYANVLLKLVASQKFLSCL